MTLPSSSPAAPFPEWSATTEPRWRDSLQFKASLLVVVLIVLVVGLGTILGLRTTSQALYENELAWTREWAASLASSASRDIQQNRQDMLQHTLDTLVRTHAVAYAVFADRNGYVITKAEGQPGLLSWALPPDGQILKLELLESPRVQKHPDSGIICVDVVAPVFAPPDSAQPGRPKAIVGYLRLASNITPTQAKLANIGARMLRLAVGIMLLVVPCSLLVTRFIVQPLNELAQTARAIARGSVDARAKVHSRNEIGQLAAAFNLMANRVMQSRMELLQLNAELEARVEERTTELEDLASKDPLTGLYNRRHFGEVITREFGAAERYHSDLTCLMFDLDRFKEINDRLGHRAGDEVLILLAQSARRQLRTADIAARFGGDEFIILLPQTSLSAARTLADRIAHEFKERAAARFPEIPVTLSIGAASLAATRATSPEALIHEADVALYAAKTAGRNCLLDTTQIQSNPVPSCLMTAAPTAM